VALYFLYSHREVLYQARARGASVAVELLGEAQVARWLEAGSPQLMIADWGIASAAARLRWAHVSGVQSLELFEDRLIVVRSVGRGDRERVAARTAGRLQALMGLGGPRKTAPVTPEGSGEPTPQALAESFVRYLVHHNV